MIGRDARDHASVDGSGEPEANSPNRADFGATPPTWPAVTRIWSNSGAYEGGGGLFAARVHAQTTDGCP